MKVKYINATKLKKYLIKRREGLIEADLKIESKIHPLSYQYKAYASALEEVITQIELMKCFEFDLDDEDINEQI